MPSTEFRVRLRVRLAKAFTTKEQSVSFTVSGREVTLLPQDKDGTLENATWVIFRVCGFDSEVNAMVFGQHLKRVVELVGLCDRLGIDVGHDKATSFFTEEFARKLGMVSEGDRIWPQNIHGVMIVPDDDHNKIPVLNLEGKVTASLEMFVQAMVEVGVIERLEYPTAAKGIWLLNQALLTNELVAQIVLAISAVEVMGQNELWAPNQMELIQSLRDQVLKDASLGENRLEVADALKSIFKFSLRQGVVRLLGRIGLSHLKKDWDEIYGQRSALVHGTAPISDRGLGELATKTLSLCGAVVLAAAKADGCLLPSITETHFPAVA
jgi:hypothetical protein